ncbi:hypothetical protein AT705_03830 [Pseudoalteromonas rubra]|uniref:Uncharacterized protein n=1 Tax=Pseudoalteromonas rubra TaxID=43658 RepID=A0A0U2P4Q7_9GAMM|nr:hypothetical protein AT705_03830 [Pseudoalteromonas rubra]
MKMVIIGKPKQDIQQRATDETAPVSRNSVYQIKAITGFSWQHIVVISMTFVNVIAALIEEKDATIAGGDNNPLLAGSGAKRTLSRLKVTQEKLIERAKATLRVMRVRAFIMINIKRMLLCPSVVHPCT